MFLRRIQRRRDPREGLPAGDRLRLLLHAWHDASDRGDGPMAARAWSALLDDALAVDAREVLDAIGLVEEHRRPAGERSAASTSLDAAVARFAAAGDQELAARFVIQDLALGAAADYRASRVTSYMARLDAIRDAADRAGLLRLRDAAAALFEDYKLMAAVRDEVFRRGAGDPAATMEQMARDHHERLMALVAAAEPGAAEPDGGAASTVPTAASGRLAAVVASSLRRPRAAGSPRPR